MSNNKKYYFFRDLDNESNLYDGKTFHAAGIVDKVFNNKENKTNNKDLFVMFKKPFENVITYAWRTYSEVELFEVNKFEYKRLKEIYNNK